MGIRWQMLHELQCAAENCESIAKLKWRAQHAAPYEDTDTDWARLTVVGCVGVQEQKAGASSRTP